MKIWVVNVNGKKNIARAFFDESDYNSWLLGTDHERFDPSIGRCTVTIYEATQLESKTVKEIKDSIKDANIRESRIQAVVSDDPWFSKYENFKLELAKYPITQPLIEKLNMLDDKKIITKYLKSQKEFLLCQVTDDVQWFELLIDFLGIKEMVDGFYQKLNGYNTRVMVSKKRKDNFLKAKENVSKAV
jgi:hypothetical protein